MDRSRFFVAFVSASECKDIIFKVLTELDKPDEEDGLKTIVRTLPNMI